MKFSTAFLTLAATAFIAFGEVPCRQKPDCRGPDLDVYVDFKDGNRYCCDKNSHGDARKDDRGRCFCVEDSHYHEDYFYQDGIAKDYFDWPQNAIDPASLANNYDFYDLLDEDQNNATDSKPTVAAKHDLGSTHSVLPEDSSQEHPADGSSVAQEGGCLQNEDCQLLTNLRRLRVTTPHGVRCCDSNMYRGLRFIKGQQHCSCYKLSSDVSCPSCSDGSCLHGGFHTHSGIHG